VGRIIFIRLDNKRFCIFNSCATLITSKWGHPTCQYASVLVPPRFWLQLVGDSLELLLDSPLHDQKRLQPLHLTRALLLRFAPFNARGKLWHSATYPITCRFTSGRFTPQSSRARLGRSSARLVVLLVSRLCATRFVAARLGRRFQSGSNKLRRASLLTPGFRKRSIRATCFFGKNAPRSREYSATSCSQHLFNGLGGGLSSWESISCGNSAIFRTVSSSREGTKADRTSERLHPNVTARPTAPASA
jgi:hypothetical protein